MSIRNSLKKDLPISKVDDERGFGDTIHILYVQRNLILMNMARADGMREVRPKCALIDVVP